MSIKFFYIKKRNIFSKIHLDPILFFIILVLLLYSILVMWSASDKNIIIMKQKIIHIFIGIIIMQILANIPPKIYKNWCFYFYIFYIILLIFVNIWGSTKHGSKRWLNIGFLTFQPSEIGKIIIPLIISRIVNSNNIYPIKITNFLISLIIILIPTFLIIKQPDLGTAILIVSSGIFVLFLSGISWKFIFSILFSLIIFIPIFWNCCMYDYQKNRITMLLNPKKDILKSGYHIHQSKIAIGSGGWKGKGWLCGTQSHLKFLPEHHTDFIFSVLAEEFGLIGVLILLLLYFLLILRCFIIAYFIKNNFGKVLIGSLTLSLFVYIFINIGMVSGIIPVVGIPLPFFSYGGSALIIFMAKFGIIMSIYFYKKKLSDTL